MTFKTDLHPDVTAYLVGGAVRDRLLGSESKDWDFAVVAPSYDVMREWIQALGMVIYLETPQYLTIRAHCDSDLMFAGTRLAGKTFDFVLCRKDGEYTDGRRPDTVEPGTLHDDLARRDFTVNAMAMDEDGKLIDPFGGETDLTLGVLRCVGSVDARIDEDPLRMLRAIRFWITKGLRPSPDLNVYLHNRNRIDKLMSVSSDRIRDELTKMMRHDPERTVILLAKLDWILSVIIEKGVWFRPTSEKR